MKYYMPIARQLITQGYLQPPATQGKGYWDEIPEQLWEDAYAAYQENERQKQELYDLRMNRNIQLFLKTPGLYAYDPEGKISSMELYCIYKQWCLAEEIPLQPQRTFWLYLKKHAPQYRLVYAGHIPDRTGKRVRGFYGIRPLSPEERKADTPHGTGT